MPAVTMILVLSGCLKLQTNEEYKGESIDPYTDVTCWEFMNSRPDLFSKMIEGIEICGMEELYQKTSGDHTYLLLTDNAIASDVNKATTPENIGALRDILLFHIIVGSYHGYNGTLSYSPTFMETLYEGEAMMSIMLYGMASNEDYIDRITLMSECGSSSTQFSIGANHLCRSGAMHIMKNKCVYKK